MFEDEDKLINTVNENKDFSKENIIHLMKETNDCGDQEIRHGLLDDLLCQFLVFIGHKDMIDIFLQKEKWYA